MHRLHRTAHGSAESAAAELRAAGNGPMWFDPGYVESLERAGLAGFDDVMASPHGRCLRVLRDRENWYLPPDEAHGQPCGMYLKKHRIRTWWTRIRAALGLGPPPSAGRVEAENVRSLRALGIPVMRVAAYGEKLFADGRLESFLLTEELEGYGELQEFFRRRFSRPGGAARDPDPRRLLRQVAEIARRFHAAGFNHRDFYTCHFLVKEPAQGHFDVRLIDLQRMQYRRWLRRRWIVKDLAQLASMAPADCVRCRDRVAFMRDYLGVRKLRPKDKRLIRAVLWKQSLIERRLRRKA